MEGSAVVDIVGRMDVAEDGSRSVEDSEDGGETQSAAVEEQRRAGWSEGREL